MHHKRTVASTIRVMETDVVGHTMLFSQASEQQARHAHSQMALQNPQGQIVGMTMRHGGLAEHQHNLLGFRRLAANRDPVTRNRLGCC